MVTMPAPDQCPDNPRNGLSATGPACPCAAMSNSPDASTAFLRQLAKGFKEKKAMTLPFQFDGRSQAAVRLHCCGFMRICWPVLAEVESPQRVDRTVRFCH